MNRHPMSVNANTRVRWESIKNLPYLKGINGKKVLDIGAGLGFFSVQFKELGADVLAIDIDSRALEHMHRNYGIKTACMDIRKDALPQGPFDIIFIGEVLEHIKNPSGLISQVSNLLTTSGLLIITTPAMEGIFTNTRGKRLGHEDGSEKHERDGFTFEELESIVCQAGFSVVASRYSVYPFAELFMQLTKLMFLRKKKLYQSQADIVGSTENFTFKVLKTVFPVFLAVFKIEAMLCRLFKVRGHCHIIIAGNRS